MVHPFASLSGLLDCNTPPFATRDDSPEAIIGSTTLSCKTHTDFPGFTYDSLLAVTHNGRIYTSSKTLTKRHTSKTRPFTAKAYSHRSRSNLTTHAHRKRCSLIPLEHDSHSLDE